MLSVAGGNPQPPSMNQLRRSRVTVTPKNVPRAATVSLSLGLSCIRTNTPAPRLRLHPGPALNATSYGRLVGGRSCVVGGLSRPVCKVPARAGRG